MSIKAPNDTAKVLETLIKESERALNDLPLMGRLLLSGAIIDAKSLLGEIQGKPPIDTHAEALLAIGKEIQKVRAE